MSSPARQPEPQLRVGSDVPFYVGLAIIGGSYVLLLAGMIIAESSYTSSDNIWAALQSREIRYSIKLSLISCAITAILSLWVSVPIGYVMSRHRFPGKALADAILDIPIVLPPLVVGLCLLILFKGPTFTFVEERLHGLERWLSVHLVGVAILGGALALCAVVYAVLRRWISYPRYRAAIALGLFAVAAFFAMRLYYRATLPDWVPVPASFAVDTVELRDQSPIVTSSDVYFARFTASGTGPEVTAAVEGALRENGFRDPRVLGDPDSLTKSGRRRYEAVADATPTGASFTPHIEIDIRPRENNENSPADARSWDVTYDVQRLPSDSRESFVPKLTLPVTFEIPAVILAQFMVACAFAVRTMRVTFDQLPTRFEEVALTLGCNRSQAFWRVVLPQCRRGMLAAGTLAWARALGEFGPILIFAGSTRMKTEVLSTTVFLELTVGNIEGAVAASLIMIFSAITVLVIARVFGLRRVAF
jgi:ABC-type sulfate transport system permease component